MSDLPQGWEPLRTPDSPYSGTRFVFSGQDVTLTVVGRRFVAVGVVGSVEIAPSTTHPHVFIDRMDINWTEVT